MPGTDTSINTATTSAHNDRDTAFKERHHKAFTTVAAQLARQGHQLVRCDRLDGTVGNYVHSWGNLKHLPDLDAVAACLRQIGGSHV